jgi:hypothetical protein
MSARSWAVAIALTLSTAATAPAQQPARVQYLIRLTGAQAELYLADNEPLTLAAGDTVPVAMVRLVEGASRSVNRLAATWQSSDSAIIKVFVPEPGKAYVVGLKPGEVYLKARAAQSGRANFSLDSAVQRFTVTQPPVRKP